MKSRSALVAYGTETGNAYDYAEELGRLLERIHFLTHVCNLNTVDTASRSGIVWMSAFADCMFTVILEGIQSSNHRCFNYRPGRSTNQCQIILEKSPTEEAITHVPKRRTTFYLWSWRQFIS